MTERLIRFAAVAAVAAGMALAQTPAARPRLAQRQLGPAQRGMIQRRLMQGLNLTDSQKQQAKAIFEQARENAKPLRDQLQQNRQALSAAMKANDSAQIRSLSAQQGTLRGQVLASQAEAQARFREILTPEQRDKMDQARNKMRDRLEKRMKSGKRAIG